MKYRKKPKIIHAIQWNGSNIDEINNFINEKNNKAKYDSESKSFLIDTLEGEMKAGVGDYIIRGIEDEVYPCKEKIFNDSYDLVEEPIIKKRKKHIIKG